MCQLSTLFRAHGGGATGGGGGGGGGEGKGQWSGEVSRGEIGPRGQSHKDQPPLNHSVWESCSVRGRLAGGGRVGGWAPGLPVRSLCSRQRTMGGLSGSVEVTVGDQSFPSTRHKSAHLWGDSHAPRPDDLRENDKSTTKKRSITKCSWFKQLSVFVQVCVCVCV